MMAEQGSLEIISKRHFITIVFFKGSIIMILYDIIVLIGESSLKTDLHRKKFR